MLLNKEDKMTVLTSVVVEDWSLVMVIPVLRTRRAKRITMMIGRGVSERSANTKKMTSRHCSEACAGCREKNNVVDSRSEPRTADLHC